MEAEDQVELYSKSGKEMLNGRVEESKLENGNSTFDQDFTPMFSHFKKSAHGSTSIHWKDLHLHIGKKHILKGISGHVSGGDVCALMGPSGAGKTCLLNVLAGRIIPSGKKKISGNVYVNGVAKNPLSYRRKIAYVMQEDVLFATSTARECLEFSAKLRLPASTAHDSEKVKQIVDDLLESLGLTEVQNTYIGSEMLRGLSGGERKRVAIGVEIVTNPNLLFLDEPTSGLDSYNAWKIVKILEALSASTGCSVLCTIHQPSSEIFNSFKNVVMLCKGEVMYNGLVRQMPAVFQANGKPIPELTNPADYAMLLAQTTKDDDFLPMFNVDKGDFIQDGRVMRDTNKNFHEELMKIELETKHYSTSTKQADLKPGMWTQTKLLCIREGRHIRRDVGFLVVSNIIRLFLFLLFGLVFANAADRSRDGYQVFNGFSVIVLVYMSWMFDAGKGPLMAFPLERGIMIREYQTGTYGSGPYLLCKLLVELPMTFLGSVLVLTYTYFLLGLEGNFFFLILALWILGLACAGYGYALGAALSDPKRAIEFIGILLVPQMLFAGVFVPITTIPAWLRWIQYLCVLKYGLNLAAFVEFGDCSDPKGAVDPNFETACQELLDANDIHNDNIWVNVVVLLGIFMVCRTLSLGILVYRANFFEN